jgi:nicotinamide mononucleotide transporter
LSINELTEYIQQNWVEISGAVLSFIYLYFSIRQKTALWIVGILCSSLYLVVFFQSKFYAEVTLQLYYLAVSIYGWINWRFGKDKDSGARLSVKKTTAKQAAVLSAIMLVVFGAYYYALSRFTDSPLPLGDSFTVALAITATWMLARKMLENWLLFIVSNALCTGLFFYKELYPTAVLFIVYTLMAVVGYFRWKAAMKRADGKQSKKISKKK